MMFGYTMRLNPAPWRVPDPWWGWKGRWRRKAKSSRPGRRNPPEGGEDQLPFRFVSRYGIIAAKRLLYAYFMMIPQRPLYIYFSMIPQRP